MAGKGSPERERLRQDGRREQNWHRWGAYLSERQWGTVREDYSADGNCWAYFPHDHARSRAYRWGEDGLLGITDRQCRLCFSFALWNERDPFLKERLFGAAGPEGNHGEDVKEEYFYQDALPTASWLQALYKYPQAEFPYARLLTENRNRDRLQGEYELVDTGAFAHDRYFDVQVTYAKAEAEDICIVLTIDNRSAFAARLHVLPQLWFRNTWAWGRTGEGYGPRGVIKADGERRLVATGADLPPMALELEALADDDGGYRGVLATENDTNTLKLFGSGDAGAFVKDAFHEAVVRGKAAIWEQRETHLRETEWSMHESAIAAAKRGLDEYLKKEKVHANLADIARMLEIASKLGRLATGLDKSNGEKSADAPQTLRVEVTVALEKIYGGEIVDVETVAALPEAKP